MKMSKVLIILIHIVIFINLSECEDAPFVKIKQAVLKGKYWKTRQDRTFSGFTGIPFAQPPVKRLRFQAPVPAEPLIGIFDASTISEVCPQIDNAENSVVGNEDCLYLNVFTPQIDPPNGQLFPVIFYIHGGSFLIGSGIPEWFGPELLLDKNIVLVTSNYRLGALGFLTTGDSVVPGNNGLKDQNLALKWVKENIINFGGNPEKITVAGNSAGGASAHLHMLSPLSIGLMSSAIIMSGSAISSFGISEKARGLHNAYFLGDSLNCSIHYNYNEALVRCLQEVDVEDIVEQQQQLLSWDGDTTLAPFRPVVEPNHDGAFLIENPVELMQKGMIADIPVMTGIVSQEGAYKAAGLNADSKLLDVFDKYFDTIAKTDFRFASEGNNVTQTQALREFYFYGGAVDNFTKTELTDMYTDGWFLWALDNTVRFQIKGSRQPVYLYLFEYRGSTSYSSLFGDLTHDYGVCHTDDLLYLFTRNFLFPDYEPTPSDIKMTEFMTTLWTNFAYSGEPTLGQTPDDPHLWQPVQSESLEFYHIKNYSEANMQKDLYRKRVNLWRNLPVEVDTD